MGSTWADLARGPRKKHRWVRDAWGGLGACALCIPTPVFSEHLFAMKELDGFEP